MGLTSVPRRMPDFRGGRFTIYRHLRGRSGKDNLTSTRYPPLLTFANPSVTKSVTTEAVTFSMLWERISGG